MTTTFPKPHVIVVLDFSDLNALWNIVDQLNPEQCRLKVGKEVFTRFGRGVVEQLVQRGFSVFLDLKFFDIPNTVVNACLAAADLGVWMVNVHALGGRKMLTAAAESLAQYKGPRPLLTAVTILTSIGGGDLHELGISHSVPEMVEKLALLSQSCGLDGVVCSAQEASMLRKSLGSNFCLVTPGIRLANSVADDQVRTMAPPEAIAAGVDYLVIGRPITRAENPSEVLKTINNLITL